MDTEGEQSVDEGHSPLVNQCPECGGSLDVTAFSPFSKIICPKCDVAVRVRTTLGRYEISKMLGEGGMSQVFKATDLTLAREVALKVLHQDLSKDSSLTAMFEREAKLTASIHHPNVVKVYTVGRDQGYFYIAMELVDAMSLEHEIAKEGAIKEEDVLAIALDVTNGLKAAYQENLIHRDIKPGNMLVLDEETTKLVDFGLAMAQGGIDESEDLWATPFYVPPEKLEGETDTFQGDIYSLGATLFHALAGKPPFAANTFSLDELKLIKAAPVSLKDSSENVSKGTIKLVEKMMAYDPVDRFDSYDEIVQVIESIQEKTFGNKKGRFAEVEGLLSSAWAKAALFGVILIAAGSVAVYFSSQNVEVEGPDLAGGGTDERVISAAEKAKAQKFLRGRKLMTLGDFAKAGKIFEELAKESALSPSTHAWNQFNRGLTRLFQGNEKDAREVFSELSTIPSFSKDDPELAGQELFLKKVAGKINQTLPLRSGDRNTFPQDTIQSLGLLAGGLKNWNMGQMEAGIEWLNLFSAAKVPPGYPWISELKPLIAKYQEDFTFISEKVPNPSRKTDSAALAKQKELLSSQLAQLKTQGYAPALLKSRISRIDTMIAEEKVILAKKAAQDASADERRKMAEVEKAKARQEKAVRKGKAKVWTPAEAAEIQRLQDLQELFSGELDALQFVEIGPKLDAEEFETEVGKALQQDLAYVYQKADGFLSSVAEKFTGGAYSGQIRQRKGEGVDLDATITSATRDIYGIDLGFGENQVRIENLSPSWLAEAAEEVFPPLSEETAGLWEELVCFVRARGDIESTIRIGKETATVLPELATRMKRLRALDPEYESSVTPPKSGQ